MTGVIILDKPQEFTSFDAVAVARGLTHERHIGHTGTLDPMATGVLPLLLGKATKAIPLLPDTTKSYEAQFCLGIKTNTGDIWGEINAKDNTAVTQESLTAALTDFTGDILQLPPMYSAVSVNGQRLYKLARQGIEIAREKRPVNIAALKLLSFDENTRAGSLFISCSKGTYIRTLIEDIAETVHTIGTMTALRRTFACGFPISEAVTIDTLRAAGGDFDGILRPVETLFADMPPAFVTEAQQARFINGGALDIERLKLPKIALRDGDRLRILGTEFLGLGAIDLAAGQLKFLKHFIS